MGGCGEPVGLTRSGEATDRKQHPGNPCGGGETAERDANPGKDENRAQTNDRKALDLG